jgi:cytochrome c-type biogenesis protein CcmF
MAPGQVAELAGFQFRFLGVEQREGPNYTAMRGTIEVTQGGRSVAVLYPEKRNYHFSAMPMTEAAIATTWRRDLYVSLGDPVDDGAWVVMLFYKPMVLFLWLGPLLMAVGGVTAALDARYRRRVAERLPAGAIGARL